MTETGTRVAVVGASGFVGRAVCDALIRQGCDVVSVRAPRLRLEDPSAHDAVVRAADAAESHITDLGDQFSGASVVVNAAGVADAAGSEGPVLFGANGLLPEVIRRAVARAGAARYVHISSAGVLGAARTLDESMDHDAFSVYTRSKACGEQAVVRPDDDSTPLVVIYRPTSVQGVNRAVTRRLVGMARSPFSSVVEADAQTPQCLVENVGAAAAFLATTEKTPPPVVLHPWEGLTAGSLLELFGGRKPRRVPGWLGRRLLRSAYLVERALGREPANARRLEMLWYGQSQAAGWLTEVGWAPPVRDPSSWSEMARTIQASEG